MLTYLIKIQKRKKILHCIAKFTHYFWVAKLKFHFLVNFGIETFYFRVHFMKCSWCWRLCFWCFVTNITQCSIIWVWYWKLQNFHSLAVSMVVILVQTSSSDTLCNSSSGVNAMVFQSITSIEWVAWKLIFRSRKYLNSVL